jgi:protein phosphatase
MIIECCGQTDVGCVRAHNEDCFIIYPLSGDPTPLNTNFSDAFSATPGLLMAVSDGMGGAAAGEIASALSLTELVNYLHHHVAKKNALDLKEMVRIVERGVLWANSRIGETAAQSHRRKGMGSTLTAALIWRQTAVFFQVGDSRAYVCRKGELQAVTRDQSFVGQLLAMGTITEEEAKRHPQRNIILQALGTDEHLQVDVTFLPLCEDDVVLLCSDGLFGEVSHEEIRETLRKVGSGDRALKIALTTLVDLARTHGGADNITCLGARMQEGFPLALPGEIVDVLSFPRHEREAPLKPPSFY